MADMEFSHGMGAYGRDSGSLNNGELSPNTLTMMANVTGAVVSLALIAGIGVWGYKLMVRDVSGIPVVRAAAGEMRVRPDAPGGQRARHQGLAVNAVAAEGEAAGPVDRVVLAPTDTDLSLEDQPITAATLAPIAQPKPLKPASEFIQGPKQASESASTSVASNLQSGAIDAVVAELTAGTAPLEGAGADATLNVEPTPATSQPIITRPKIRPANFAPLTSAAPITDKPTAEVDAASIPAGTRLAQLGAFDSAQIARSEWTRLETRFGDYLQDKSRVVQQAQTGGRTFYRLRAMGFVDLGDARRFCSAFKAEGVDCIPVAVK